MWLTFPTESKSLKRRGEQFLEVRKVLKTPMQDTGTARERKLVRRSVWEAEPAAANSASREREFSAWVSREQDASKAKENLNNLDTKAPAKRGDIKLRERVRNTPCDHLERRGCCNFGTNDQREE